MMKTLDELDETTRALLRRYGFDEPLFEQLRRRLIEGRAEEDDNRVGGCLEPMLPGDLVRLPPLRSAARESWADLGRESLARGQVCAVVLAGGMATRFGGVVKASVEVLPQERSSISARGQDRPAVAARGRSVPVLLMTSFATDAEITALAHTLGGQRLDFNVSPISSPFGWQRLGAFRDTWAVSLAVR